MAVKKLVVPGEHLASAEEVMPGDNTYSENDEVYSSAFGEMREREHKLEVGLDQGRKITTPQVGSDLYCVVRRLSPTKAFVNCVPFEGFDKKGSVSEVSAVLPVQNIKRDHVREMRDELRAGDIIKAKISKIVKEGIDISIFGPAYGVVRAFCSDCRSGMVLKDSALICSSCGKEEKRKLSADYPQVL